jgi:hypoxanthine phosphoribosyltransferase
MNKNLHDDIQEILFTEQQLQLRVVQLGHAIRADYQDKEPLIIGVLRGSFIFMADLVRQIDIPCRLDFITASSYGSKSTSSGTITLKKEMDLDVTGRHVILVEDILDTGNTLRFLVDLIKKKDPASVEICTLLDKPSRREVDVEAKYIGFPVPNYFVVGYGLDYDDKYRSLPYIGVLKPEVYSD